VSTETPQPSQIETGSASGCWLRGCLVLAMVVPAVLVLILLAMTLSRMANPA